MAARRTLHDLFTRGTTVKIGDGAMATDEESGEEVPLPPVEVWVQKISPDEHERCQRRANGARAKILLALRDLDNDERLAILASINDVDRETLVDYLIADERFQASLSIEAELELGEDPEGEPTEWGKDGYLQGLRDLWEDRLRQQWADDENDPEAARVLTEMRRFAAEVDRSLERVTADLRAGYEMFSVEELRDKALEHFIEERARREWWAEYEHSRLYFAVRKPENHRSYYWSEDGFDAVHGLEQEVLDRLLDAYAEVAVEAVEGKGSPRTTGSSLSSEQPGAPATPASSSLETSSA